MQTSSDSPKSYIVAFFLRQFTERGTEIATYDYAHYNEVILGNKSIIVCFSTKTQSRLGWSATQVARQKFQDRFKVIEIDNIMEMRTHIKAFSITHFYALSSGYGPDIYDFHNKDIWSGCKTIYHAVFGPGTNQRAMAKCVIGSSINKKYFTRRPVVPHMVHNQHQYHGNLRKKLEIPINSIVFGRYGGYDTFDIKFVYKSIAEALGLYDQYYFLFMNTRKFVDHPRAIFLDSSTSSYFKSLFINTCDAMLHARSGGETFGLAVAEFSMANKPVITCDIGDREHLEILGSKSIVYRNKFDLDTIFAKAPSLFLSHHDWNAYADYTPEKVMAQFKEHCLDITKKRFMPLVIEQLRDLLSFVRYRYVWLQKFLRFDRDRQLH